MARRSGRTRLALLVAVAGIAVLAAAEITSVSALDSLGGLFWTALFWLLVAVILVLLVWQVFPTPSR